MTNLALDGGEPQFGLKRVFGSLFGKLESIYAGWRVTLGIRSNERGEQQRAVRHFLAAARRGQAEAQLRLARHYARGYEGVFANPGDALYWYREAARRGNPEAQFEASLLCLHGRQGRYSLWYETARRLDEDATEQNAAALFPHGIAAEQNPTEALYWGLQAAEQGHVEAQANVGLQYLHGQGCEPNYEAARHWLEKAAASGNAEAEFGIGISYANGMGVPVDLDAAVAWYEKAASQGNESAQVALGVLYATGTSVERDPHRAADLLGEAARNGNVRALHSLGLLWMQGDGIEKDLASAESCFRRAARRDYIPAILSLAEMYATGLSVVPNVEDSVLWYRLAADLGSVEAQYNLGILYSAEDGRAREAAIWYDRAAQQGYAPAQFKIAACYFDGVGIAADKDKALAWVRIAAEGDFLPAQLSLAEILLAGEDVPADAEGALWWLQRAAAKGDDGEAEFRIANIHSTGKGVTRNPAEAAKWYRLAAERGHRFAQHNLADLLLAEGNAAGAAEAAIWFSKAAEQGLPESQLTIGDLFASGRGVARDVDTARVWYKKAAKQGLSEAKTRLASLVRDGKSPGLATAPRTDIAEVPSMPEKQRSEVPSTTGEQALEAAPGAGRDEPQPIPAPQDFESELKRAEPESPSPGQSAGEPVRLVIWDLDETFWDGTLSEGGVRSYVQDNHDIVVTLARRGIMSSICSKNDLETVRTILAEHSVWDYFIFPSIDWTAKGRRLAAIIEAVQLRPASVLFIDDNPMNLAEAAALVPGIQVADVGILPRLLADPRFKGKNDEQFSRLSQYKLLEKRTSERLAAGSDDEAFLRASNIRVIVENDVVAHLDRAIELINRTNQLNFTKRRLPEDIEEARSKLHEDISPYFVRAGLIRVVDNYGDYGFCGYYRFVDSELRDYCFSCRILGMGVEQWLYDRFGRPQIDISGEVLTDLSQHRAIDWITLVEKTEDDDKQPAPSIPEVRLRGGCDLDALAHYFRLISGKVALETNRHRDPLFVRMDCSAQLLPALSEPPPEFYPAVQQIGYTLNDFSSEFLSPAAPGTVLIYEAWGDLYVKLYRHKATGFAVPLTVGVHEDLTKISRAGLDKALADLNANAAVNEGIRRIAAVLRDDYVHESRLALREAVAILQTVFDRIPPGAELFVILPYEWMKSDNGDLKSRRDAIAYNNAVRTLASRYRSVTLVSMSELVSGGDEMQLEFDHFDRLVYFRMYERIVRELKAKSQPAIPEMSDMPEQESRSTTDAASADPVQLVIWGVDDLLKGVNTSTETAGSDLQRFQEVVLTLARRGIMSSICTSDQLSARPVFEQYGIWSFFLFPSTDDSGSKAERVAGIIELAQLRAPNALFVDSNAIDRAATADLLPGIQIADASVLPMLLDDSRCEGTNDRNLTTLARYKVLERSHIDRTLAHHLGNTSMPDSNIRIAIEPDVAAHVDRAIALINGYSDLNFTKRRLPDGIDDARQQLLSEIRPYDVRAGLIRVFDDFGDCGYCGFYRLVEGELVDYCFSRNIVGMGVEQWLFEHLGRPAIAGTAEAPPELSESEEAGDWVTLVEGVDPKLAVPMPYLREVRLRGAGEVEALAHYFLLVAGEINLESNDFRPPLYIHMDSSASLLLSMDEIPLGLRELMRRIGYVPEDFASQFLSGATSGSTLVYSPWADVYVSIYRHKTANFAVPVSVGIDSDLTTISDDELSEALDSLGSDDEQAEKIRSIVAELRANYTHEPNLDVAEAVAIMRKMFERIPAGARLFLILPHEWAKWDMELEPRPVALAHNSAIRELADAYPSVTVVTMTGVVGDDDFLDGLDLFDRIVYARLFQGIMHAVAQTEAGAASGGNADRNLPPEGDLTASGQRP